MVNISNREIIYTGMAYLLGFPTLAAGIVYNISRLAGVGCIAVGLATTQVTQWYISRRESFSWPGGNLENRIGYQMAESPGTMPIPTPWADLESGLPMVTLPLPPLPDEGSL